MWHTDGEIDILISTSTTTSSYSSTSTSSCAVATAMAITFDLFKQTSYGESLTLVGSIPQLGSWTPSNGIALSARYYSSSSPMWYITVTIASGASFQYKYVSSLNGSSTYEDGSNRTYQVAGNCNGSTTQVDYWQYPAGAVAGGNNVTYTATYTTVSYRTQTLTTSYPVTTTAISTQVQTYTSSYPVTATLVSTAPGE